MSVPVAIPGLGIEIETTRDVLISEADGTVTSRPCSPPGDGWHITDASDEKRTVWRRLKITDMRGQPVPPAPCLPPPPWRD